jgi:hypothetical protein
VDLMWAFLFVDIDGQFILEAMQCNFEISFPSFWPQHWPRQETPHPL